MLISSRNWACCTHIHTHTHACARRSCPHGCLSSTLVPVPPVCSPIFSLLALLPPLLCSLSSPKSDVRCVMMLSLPAQNSTFRSHARNASNVCRHYHHTQKMIMIRGAGGKGQAVHHCVCEHARVCVHICVPHEFVFACICICIFCICGSP